MGVDLKSILVKDTIKLDELKGKVITIDASNILHQFLSTIRKPDGTPLTDSQGNVTSHLIGLFYRTLKMMREFSVKPVYVFDGEMPDLKTDVVEERAERRIEAKKKWSKAKQVGKDEKAFKEAVKTGFLDDQMIKDAKRLLDNMGLPTVQALAEAEAQCAYMTHDEEIYAMNSRDYDSMLFGASRLLRYMTISNKDNIEIIDLDKFLNHHGISWKQLVDMGILIGTDYNEGIFRVGPKTALKLIKRHGSIEKIPEKYQKKLGKNYEDVRRLFLDPPLIEDYSLEFKDINRTGVMQFLCEERDFPHERVLNNLEK